MQRWIVNLMLLACFCVWSTDLAQASDCIEPPTADVIADGLKQSERSIYMVKYDASLQRLDELEAVIPCAEFTIPKDSLTRLFLLRGVAYYNNGNERGALADFRRALGIDFTLRWNERFGQKPRELFLEAKSSLLTEDKGEVRLPIPSEGISFYLDGVETPGAGGIDVTPGRHLLQVFKADGLLEGVWLDVPSGGTVLPPLPREAGRQVATAPIPAERPPRSGGGEWRRPTSLGLLGVGGGAGLVGVAGSALYWQGRLALQNGEYYSNRPDDEKDKLLARQATGAKMANIALPAAAVFLGAGAGLYIYDGRQGGGEALLLPLFGPTGGGLQIAGRF